MEDWISRPLSLVTFLHWRRKWQPTPVFLPGESQGQQSLMGCCLWGCTESNTTEVIYEKKLSFLAILRGTMVVLCVSYLASPRAEISSMENRFASRADFSGCNLITTKMTGQPLNQVPERLDGASRSPVCPLLSPALTHQPHVRSPGALEPGRQGNLTCSVPWACERATPPIFSWTSAAPSSLGPRTPFSSVLTLTPRPQDHGTRLTCQVKFPTSGAMVFNPFTWVSVRARPNQGHIS